MEKYSVYVDITFAVLVEVSADSEVDAKEIAEDMVADDPESYINDGTSHCIDIGVTDWEKVNEQ